MLVRDLSVKQREEIIKRVGKGVSVQEVAADFNMRPGQVRSLVKRTAEGQQSQNPPKGKAGRKSRAAASSENGATSDLSNLGGQVIKTISESPGLLVLHMEDGKTVAIGGENLTLTVTRFIG